MTDKAGRRLAEWRNKIGLSQRALASRIGASQGFVSDIENGRSEPSRNFLTQLSGTFRVNPAWVLEGAEPMLLDGGTPPQPDADQSFVSTQMQYFSQVQMYEAQLAAGAGAHNSTEEAIGNLAFRTDWLRREGVSPGAASLVRVRGDSMEPTLRDGALVLVDHRHRDASRSGIYALRIGDDVLVKRLQKQGDLLLVNSDNPACPSRVLSGHDAEQVEIIGRVAWQGYTFRQ